MVHTLILSSKGSEERNEGMNQFKSVYLAIGVSVFLVIFKVMAGRMTHSISIVSDAMHSSMDVIASAITLAAMKLAQKPVDECHAYGHGRYEDFAAALQCILILLVSAAIIGQAVQRIRSQDYLTETVPGIVVMLVSILLHTGTVLIMLKYSKEADSIALRANALHLLTDVITSVGVILGLIVIHFTGLKLLDPVAAILVALVIIKTGCDIGKESIGQLLDRSLASDEIEGIEETLKEYQPPVLAFHHLRTRRVGRLRLVDVHLVFPDETSLSEAHDVSSRIERDLHRTFEDVRTTIHLEPKAHEHPHRWDPAPPS